MTAVTRKTLWAALAFLALGLTGCPEAPKPDGGPTGGGTASNECVEDSDCPDPQYFFCNTVTSKCEPSCRSASQCNPASVNNGTRPTQYALDFCTGSLGCQCDEGKCVGSLCSSNVLPMTYTLTASPVVGKSMDGDKCGAFIVDQTGAKTLYGASATTLLAECWKR